MNFRDFLLMSVVCFSFATSAIVTRLVVFDLDVPPLIFTAARSAIVIACTFPWLFPLPTPRLTFLATAALMGLGGFALMFIGLRYAQPSSVAIVSQLTIPFTVLLGVVLLGERLDKRRLCGTLMALAGVLLVIWQPEGLQQSAGLIWVVMSALAGSVGVITLKRIYNLEPIRLQAWVGMTAALPCAVLSVAVDDQPMQDAWNAGWPFLLASIYSALIVSIFAQNINYRLLRKYPAHMLAPLMVMAPIFTIVLGLLITGDVITFRFVIGGAIALTGVMIIVARPKWRIKRYGNSTDSPTGG